MADINDLLNGVRSELDDYSKMKKRLVLQLLSSNGNGHDLNELPYHTMEDMVQVYRFDLGPVPGGQATCLVTNKMLDHYGISRDQLERDTLLVAAENRPATFKRLDEALIEMGGLSESGRGSLPFYIASVVGGSNGACAICYPGFLDRVANELDGDFFVLPSSIHEVLILPDNGIFERADLENMVHEVNRAEVAPEERLSDFVYHYDSGNHLFENARLFEVRMEQKRMYKRRK